MWNSKPRCLPNNCFALISLAQKCEDEGRFLQVAESVVGRDWCYWLGSVYCDSHWVLDLSRWHMLLCLFSCHPSLPSSTMLSTASPFPVLLHPVVLCPLKPFCCLIFPTALLPITLFPFPGPLSSSSSSAGTGGWVCLPHVTAAFVAALGSVWQVPEKKKTQHTPISVLAAGIAEDMQCLIML